MMDLKHTISLIDSASAGPLTGLRIRLLLS